MFIMVLFFICSAFLIRFCGQNKLEYDYNKFILEKNLEKIIFYEKLFEGFTEKELNDIFKALEE